MNAVPQIFDWQLTRAQAYRMQADAFLTQQLAERLTERLLGLAETPKRVALFGPLPPALQTALPHTAFLPAVIDHTGKLQVEDGQQSICTIFADLGRLSLVNDLPGALAQIKMALPSNGGFFSLLYGGSSLFELRQALLTAETELTGGIAPRLHPLLSAESGLALLQRAGFTTPVADRETFTVDYSSLHKLVRDLRTAGLSNQLATRARGIPARQLFTRAMQHLSEHGTQPLTTSFEIVALTGWKA